MGSGKRQGDPLEDSLLHGLHGDGCPSGTEYSAMRPVSTDVGYVVIFMTWCSDCGAAAWEVV